MAEPINPLAAAQQERTEGGADAGKPAEAYFDGKGGALLRVEVPCDTMNDEMNVLGQDWKLKEEFHATLVGFAMKLEKKIKAAAVAAGETMSNREAKERAKAIVEEAAEGVEFSVTFSPELRIAEKGDSHTILKMCEIEGADAFYAKLEGLAGLETGSLEQPPAHVTLYTGEDGKGIGIASQAKLDELTRILDDAEMEQIRTAANKS